MERLTNVRLMVLAERITKQVLFSEKGLGKSTWRNHNESAFAELMLYQPDIEAHIFKILHNALADRGAKQ